MALFVLFAAFVLCVTTVHVAGQPGFLSLDCGLEVTDGGRYNESYDGIFFVADDPYVDSGERHRVAAEHNSAYDYLKTLRSFPSGARNCYTLPAESGGKYLLRLQFLYGNYDGKNSSSSLEFDLHLGTNLWVTAILETGYWVSEAVFVAWANRVPVCLVNTGGGTPFLSSVELRRLEASMYPNVTAQQHMNTYTRGNTGGDQRIRYPEDPYDRFWWPTGTSTGSRLANLSTRATIQPDDEYAVPMPVLQTAITVVGNGTMLMNTWRDDSDRQSIWRADSDRQSNRFMLFLHFADFQNSQLREFYINFNEWKPYLYSPPYLTAACVYTIDSYTATDGEYNITLAATAGSLLPPMLNAYEVYNLVAHNTPTTFSKDVDAIMAIKLEYGVKKNWMGDPCFPIKYTWDGVKCSTTSGSNTTRIISLDLSNSNLDGMISNNFSLFTALQYLDLSGNRLNGSIPDSICKNNSGSLVFRYESDEDMCNKTIRPPPPGNKRIVIISISVAVPVLVVVILVSYLIWRRTRKPSIATQDPPGEPELQSAPASTKSHEDHLQNAQNRRFTYKELEKFTNRFERFIGKGGFGNVYYGRLEDDTEVAVKMRSESSSHGLDQFLAEVQSLTKVHHRNLVSLVGYCWEKHHLALVYEYMSRGNLCDQLRGQNDLGETLNWATRLRVALEAAQGLDYLHKGCSLPIIHRDVKTSNILLSQHLQAKIADFGLCKTYLSDMQTHISTIAAGSAGYMDPQYYHTGRLTENSDVYSFGVVLLEVATGEPPILPSHSHIVQRVKQKAAAGNISWVADARLGDAYDVSSMWKVIDTAMACTMDDSIRRPTMAAVVVQLRESLALEEARKDSGVRGSVASSVALASTFGPSAR